mgnify:CR=1 FL=1
MFRCIWKLNILLSALPHLLTRRSYCMPCATFEAFRAWSWATWRTPFAGVIRFLHFCIFLVLYCGNCCLFNWPTFVFAPLRCKIARINCAIWFARKRNRISPRSGIKRKHGNRQYDSIKRVHDFLLVND